MSTVINNIKVDFGLGVTPPRVTFQQGANMNVPGIRDTLRQIEASSEGRGAPGAVSGQGQGNGWIARASGNFPFSSVESSALTVEIMSPFKIFFDPGPIAYKTDTGNLLGSFIDSPGAVVQINNAVGSTNLASADIEFASFEGGVTIDTGNITGNAVPGTLFPIGTPRKPSDNLTDADSIEDTRGFKRFFVKGALTIPAGVTLPEQFVGDGMARTTITVDAAADVTLASFSHCMLIGAIDGAAIFDTVHFMNVSDVLGVARGCMLQGTITLGGTPSGAHGNIFQVIDCTDALVDGTTPIIDFNVTGFGLSMRSFSGDVTLRNKTGVDGIEINLLSGTVTIEATVTAGNIVVSGIGKVVDNSTGTTTVDVSGLTSPSLTAAAVWNALTASANVAGSFGQLVGKKLLTVAKFLGLGS